MVCEAVPGAKGAIRRRKVYMVGRFILGLGDGSTGGRQVQGMWEADRSVSWFWESSDSETLGPFLAL